MWISHQRLLSLSLFVGLLSFGCATGVYHDRQFQNANYYSGRTEPIVYPQFRVTSPREPGEFRSGSAMPPPGNINEETFVSLFASALSLVRNPDYYKKSTIGGRCLFEAPADSTLEIPCVNITVALTDSRGHELNRYNSNNGTFEFFVERNKDYGIMVISDRYAMASQSVGPVSMGDDIVIRLMPKKPSPQAD